jgi:hypothetical protein
MKTITTAVLLTAIGALAQGAPPSLVPWQSGWSGTTQAHQAQARGAATSRPDSRATLAGNSRSVPVAGNAQSHYQGS